jgi:hypothetical protein
MVFKVVGLSIFVVFMNLSHCLAAEKLIWKTELDFAQVQQTSVECKPDDSECFQADHVSYEYVSHYGRRLYLTYEEASRVYLSFDAPLDVDPDAQRAFAYGQEAHGAYDWGGIMQSGKFTPLYAIKRFYDPDFDYGYDIDKTKSGLHVWRLSDGSGNGRSEIIGMAGAENSKARALAENDFAKLQVRIN